MATSWQGTLLRRLILVLFSFFVPLAYPLGAHRGQGGFKMCHGICYFLEKKELHTPCHLPGWDALF